MDETTRAFLVGLFREAYEGNWRGTETYFVDNRPEAGLFGTLEKLSASEASEMLVRGTSSIFGHVAHLTIAMEATRDELDGGRPEIDWEGTWAVQTTDESTWAAQKEALSERYRELRERFEQRPWAEPLMQALAYSTAHAAWHLGAIRQLMGERVVRQG